MQLTLWHPKGCQHEIYGMTCEQYEDLRKRAGDLCEICRTPWHPLGIDHDHGARTGFPEGVYRAYGMAGVRGLLCPKCNSHMRFIDSGERAADEPTARYLANAWHIHNLPPETFPVPNPEPPMRSVVRAHGGSVWKRLKNGWTPVRWPANRIREYGPRTWVYLSYRYGPENLHLIEY